VHLGPMFAFLGMNYAWATPEYLLWHCSLGMCVMFHNIAMDLKYPSDNKETNSLRNASPEKIAEIKKQIHEMYGETE
jgi:hypothetical protein